MGAEDEGPFYPKLAERLPVLSEHGAKGPFGVHDVAEAIPKLFYDDDSVVV